MIRAFYMFSDKLINWYHLHKRDLPWRNTKNPYFIWLSEIILQQTRVDQGMSYYLKFIKHYPTIHDLARAEEVDVLKDWQGLGYYNRARNMHAAAKFVVSDLKGIFPTNYNDLIQLKGVGEYTAAAISSFAFDEVKATVDSNVYRVLARYFDCATPIDSSEGKKEFQTLANQLVSHEQPANFNQAIMEFGALQCVPVNPNCDACVLVDSCLAFQNNTVNLRPIKIGKIKIRKRYFYYALFQENDKLCVQKRTKSDIWRHLYEFPLYEASEALSLKQVKAHYKKEFDLKPLFISESIKHILSHQHIFARFIHFDSIPPSLKKYEINKTEFDKLPINRMMEKYLTRFN